MNKITKIILAILAGVDVTITIFTPMILAAIWISIAGFNLGSYFVYGLGLLATIFRAIKVGWMK